MFGFLLGKELENGDIQYGISYIDNVVKDKKYLVKTLEKMLSKDRPAMLQKNLPIRIVSKNFYLGDSNAITKVGGIEQGLCSNERFYLGLDGVMYCYNETLGKISIVN